MDTVPVWVSFSALIVACIGVSFTAANYFEGRRERQRNASATNAEVKATINATRYAHGWRSVQLHIGPTQETQSFQYGNWRIQRAELLQPLSAVLARAENDDYATGVFFPENPVRVLEGKPEGMPQRFALEFFIRFKGEDKGQKAKFRVTFSRVNDQMRRTVTVWVMVPNYTEPAERQHDESVPTTD
jgi:hypothetical protein